MGQDHGVLLITHILRKAAPRCRAEYDRQIEGHGLQGRHAEAIVQRWMHVDVGSLVVRCHIRSEEHTSELQSLMRISYAVFCLKKKKHKHTKITLNTI